VPTLAIFGPTTRELGFFPYGDGHRVMEVKDLPCRPCALHGGRKCPHGHFKCMKDISPDTVFENAKEMLLNNGYKIPEVSSNVRAGGKETPVKNGQKTPVK